MTKPDEHAEQLETARFFQIGTPEEHLVLMRKVPCGAPGCPEVASRRQRCRRCWNVVARCGAHDQNLDQETKEHCSDMASCRSCNADIEWAEWEASGKAIPLDRAPDPKGNLVLVAGKVRMYKEEDAKLARERRVSHFATCPHRDDWRTNR